VITFVWEKFVQNMVRVVECVHEKVVMHVRRQLRLDTGIITGVEAR